MSVTEVVSIAGTISAIVVGVGGLALQIQQGRRRASHVDAAGTTARAGTSVISSALLLFGLTLAVASLTFLLVKSDFAWWGFVTITMAAFASMLGGALAVSLKPDLERVSPVYATCGYLLLACSAILIMSSSLLVNALASYRSESDPRALVLSSSIVQALIATVLVAVGVMFIKGHPPTPNTALGIATISPMSLLVLGAVTIGPGWADDYDPEVAALVGGILPIAAAVLIIIAISFAFQPGKSADSNHLSLSKERRGISP